jgi:hypothetical protein
MSANRQIPRKFPAVRAEGHVQEERNQFGTPGGPFSEHTAHMQTSEARALVEGLMTEPISPISERNIPARGLCIAFSKHPF